MDQHAFTVDTLVGIQHVASRVPLHLSPDGTRLALSAQRARRAAAVGGDRVFTPDGMPTEMVGSRVLVVDTVTGKVDEPFLPIAPMSWAAQWSPDGQMLAAYVHHAGRPCLGIWETGTGACRVLQHVLVHPVFGFEVPRWTPDSRTVIVKLTPAHPSAGATSAHQPPGDGASRVTIFAFNPADQADGTTEPPSPFDWYRCDLGQVDVGTGEVRRLATDWSLIGWEVAPDGHAVATLIDTHYDNKLGQFYFDLMVVPFDGDTPRKVAARIPQSYGMCLAWAPDSRHIAYTTGETGKPGRCFIVPADGSHAALDLTGEADIDLAQEYEIPRWSADSRFIYCLSSGDVWAFAADGSHRRKLVDSVPDREVIGWIQRPLRGTLVTFAAASLLALVRDPHTKNEGLAHLDLQSGQGSLLTDFAQTCLDRTFGVEAAPDGSTMYLVLQAADHPSEVWQIDTQAWTPRRLLSLNPDLTNLALGTSRPISWRALNGKQLQGALLLPPHFVEGQPVPLIVQVYGGYLGSNVLHRFGFDGMHLDNAQLLASQGYAVLWPDMPLADHGPVRQLPGLVLPALNHLIDLGVADPDRIGLLGHSYGGYCVLALLTQTDRFRAAVCIAGIANLTSYYGVLTSEGVSNWLGWVESGQGRLRGTLWEKRDAYIENSPLVYFDQVRTPVLLVSGTAHPGEPTQSEEAFSALRRLGKRVELRVYQGEAHWPGVWSEASLRDLCAAGLRWFDAYLKG